jgi:pimeloyl-ACP methyl ester carboxylesterase
LSEVPTLVLWGNQDRVICASDAKRCAGHSRSEIHVAKGVGHMLPLEAPAWTNAHIRRFVAALRSQPIRVRDARQTAPALGRAPGVRAA